MTYEYVCSACGKEWEAEQRISEAPLKDCPLCGQAAAKRQISAGAGFILKGGGWYSDGYASAKGGDKHDTSSKPVDSKATKSDAPATKSETGSSGKAAAA